MDKAQKACSISDSEVIQRIAALTRMLRDSMQELGLEQVLKEAAVAVPNVRDRLRYIAKMTESAAERTLNAAEHLRPIHDALINKASALDKRWEIVNDTQPALPNLQQLIQDTRGFLNNIAQQAQPVQDNLREIIMAQDFQDLTGQVILKMMNVITSIENELLKVLLDHIPHATHESSSGLLNGPQIHANPKHDVVTNQDQVDDLLTSLGF